MLHYVRPGSIMAFTRALARELGGTNRVNTWHWALLERQVMSENPGHVQTARDAPSSPAHLRRGTSISELAGGPGRLASADSDLHRPPVAVRRRQCETPETCTAAKKSPMFWAFRREIVSLIIIACLGLF